MPKFVTFDRANAIVREHGARVVYHGDGRRFDIVGACADRSGATFESNWNDEPICLNGAGMVDLQAVRLALGY